MTIDAIDVGVYSEGVTVFQYSSKFTQFIGKKSYLKESPIKMKRFFSHSPKVNLYISNKFTCEECVTCYQCNAYAMSCNQC